MRPMVLLFVALFNSILGFSVLFPVLAPLGRQLGLSELEVTSLSTMYSLMQFLTSPWWGKQSERRGRKPTLLVGVVGFAIGFAAFGGVALLGLRGMLGHLPLLLLLLATRALGGALSAATLPTAQAWAADLSERQNRTAAMGMIGAAFGLGVIFGPAIGAGLSTVAGSLLAPVWFSSGVAVVNAIFILLWLREPPQAIAASAEIAAERGPLLRRVWPLLAIGLAITLSSVAMEQTVAFYFADRLHIATSDGEAVARVVGLALVGYGIVAVLAQGFIVRRWKWAPRSLMAIGLPIAVCGFVLFVFAREQIGLTSALMVQGLGQGLALPG
ncbi:MAG: MFS transporter, partial [Sandaracinaceae bacterium]|nr:MFS transporter [Sandaracinaceae bacterium]